MDFELCFICQLRSKQTDYTNYVLHPSLPSVEKLIASTDVRCSCGETEFSALKDRISGLSADELLRKSVSYHKTCYKDLTNKTHVERAKMRYEKGQATGSVSDVKQKKKRTTIKIHFYLYFYVTTYMYQTSDFRQGDVCHLPRRQSRQLA